MRKQNKLVTVNKHNKKMFAQGVDREHNNIFDGAESSVITTPYFDPYYGYWKSAAVPLDSRQVPSVGARNSIISPVNSPTWGSMSVPQFNNAYTNSPTLYPYSLRSSELVAPSLNGNAISAVPNSIITNLDSKVQSSTNPLSGYKKEDLGVTVSDLEDAIAKSSIETPKKGFWSGSGAGPQIVGAVGNMVGSAVGNKARHGYTGGGGAAIGAIGSTIGGLLMTNPATAWLGAGLMAASPIVGAFSDRTLGIKRNEGNINAALSTAGTAKAVGEAAAKAQTSSGLLDATRNMTANLGLNGEDYVKKGWARRLLGHKNRAGNEYRDKVDTAIAMQNHGIELGEGNIARNQKENAIVNFGALGGLLNMGNIDPTTAIGYDLLHQNALSRDTQANAKGNTFTNLFAGAPNVVAKGGRIEIKHPGRLTALKKRTGKTEAELYNDGNPEHKKMVVFARNARKWKKAYGGFLDAADNLFALGGDTGPKEETSVRKKLAKGWFDNVIQPFVDLRDAIVNLNGWPYSNDSKGGTFGGANGSFLGAGSGGDFYSPTPVPPRENEFRGLAWPTEKTFNDAYAEARRKGLKTFKFNGKEYSTEYDTSNNPERAKAHKEAGDKRKQYGFNGVGKWRYADGGTMMAFGGNLEKNGADYPTGLIHIDEGGSHEENPYQGVQMGVDPQGTPNLVEEGEVIYKDYVFSNRIYADEVTLKKFHLSPKRKITYAKLAKKLEKEIAERPNDPVSEAAFDKQMAMLAEEQERQKQEEQAREAQEAFAQLPPEEQVALMQQEQQAQEQGMEEQAAQEQMMQQQPSEEEMMAQQMVAQQQMPPQGIMPQGITPDMIAQQGMPIVGAYGGLLNQYGYGGNLFRWGGPTGENDEDKNKYTHGVISWLAQNHPELSTEEKGKIASAMERRARANRKMYSYLREKGRGWGEFDYDNMWNSSVDKVNDKDITKAMSNWIQAGLSKDIAFKLVVGPYPEKSSQTVKESWEKRYKYYTGENYIPPKNKDTADSGSTSIPQTLRGDGRSKVTNTEKSTLRAQLGPTSFTQGFNSLVNTASKLMQQGDVFNTVEGWNRIGNWIREENKKIEPRKDILGNVHSSPEVATKANTELFKKNPQIRSDWDALKKAGYSDQDAFAYIRSTYDKSGNRMDSSTGATSSIEDTLLSNPNQVADTLLNQYYQSAPSQPSAPATLAPAPVPQGQGVSLESAVAQAAAQDNPAQATVATTATTPTVPVNLWDNNDLSLGQRILTSLDKRTWNDFLDWAKENNLDDDLFKEGIDKTDWNTVLANQAFKDALGKLDDTSLAHAIRQGYDYGNYKYIPKPADIQSINVGNWSTSGSDGDVKKFYDAWKNSTDEMWNQAKITGEEKSIKEIQDKLMATEAWKKTTDYLKASPDNMLNYLQAIESTPDAPEKAKKHYEKYVEKDETGKLKWNERASKMKTEDLYNELFHKVRTTLPGTYWHSFSPALSGEDTLNFIQDKNGNWAPLETGTDGLTLKRQYKYANDKGNHTLNYYISGNGNAVEKDAANKAIEELAEGKYDIRPRHKDSWMRYAPLFGAPINLGLMAAGVGKPKLSRYDSALAGYEPVTATYEPVGGYMAYSPMDIWAAQNSANAQARAISREIVNNASPIGQRMAGDIALAYNNDVNEGKRHREAMEYDDKLRQATTAHNLGVDVQNAQAFNALSQYNASALNNYRQNLAGLRLNIADKKNEAEADWYNQLYGNIGQGLTALGKIGNENEQFNMMAELAALGVFGPMNPRSAWGSRFFEIVPRDETTGQAAKGGKIRRRKGGLTY